jgi:glycogen synthase
MTADAVGGVWRYSVDLARALLAHGVNTTLAVMGPAPSRAQHREAALAGIPVVSGAYRLEWMDDAGRDVELAGDWLLALEQVIRPHLVHLNGYAHAGLQWMAPVLVVAHSCVRTWWKAVKGTNAPDQYERYTSSVGTGLRAANALVAPTQAMLAALADEYSVDAAGLNAQVIPNGCRGPARKAPDWRTKKPFVLSAGRVWDEAKNIRSLCAVAPQVTWPVYVAGDDRGPDGTDIDLTPVRRLGVLPAARLRGWYRRASIYALPARYEPFGLSVLEAARAGCALVLGDIPSLRENWDGAAVFVAPDDRPGLVAAIERLIGDQQTRRAIARRAWARSTALSIDRTATEYLHLYDRLYDRLSDRLSDRLIV